MFATVAPSVRFDPGFHSLTGWWRAGDYASGTWTGRASAGASLGRDLVQATGGSQPAAGATVNGFTPPDFDGTNDSLPTVAPVYITDLVSASAGLIAVVFNADTSAAAQASPNFNNDRAIFSDTAGRIGIAHTSTGVRAYCYNGTTRVATTLITAPTGVWGVALAWWDSTNLSCQFNSGSPQSVAEGGAITFAATTLARAGLASTGFFDGRVAEILTMNTTPSLDFIENVRSYLSNRYAI